MAALGPNLRPSDEKENLMLDAGSPDWMAGSNGQPMRRDFANDVETTHISPSSTMIAEADDGPGKCGPFSWSILPITISVTSVVGFVVTYVFAKVNCHVQKWILPFVSYTGTEHPESMIFGLLLNIEGFLGFTVVFLAWRYYKYRGQKGKLNACALFCGWLCCLGVVMVGNFQVSKGKVPHYIGAGLAFLCGTAYAYMATFLSRASFRNTRPPLRWKRLVVAIRLSLAILMSLSLVCLLGLVIYKKISKKISGKKVHYPSHPHNGSDCEDILSSIPDSKKHMDLTASLSEWILTAALLGFLSLFAYEFSTFQKVKVLLICRNAPLSVGTERNGEADLLSETKLNASIPPGSENTRNVDSRSNGDNTHSLLTNSELHTAGEFTPG